MNYYVHLEDGGVVEVQNVTAITIASPMLGNGTYRDAAAVVTGGASAVASTTGPLSATIAGGTNPTAQAVSGNSATASGGTSVEQWDSFTHVAPRFLFGPIALIFFTTTNFPATTPTGASFTTTTPTVPAGNFAAVTTDVIFKWDEIVGYTNVPPPGFSPFSP